MGRNKALFCMKGQGFSWWFGDLLGDACEKIGEAHPYLEWKKSCIQVDLKQRMATSKEWRKIATTMELSKFETSSCGNFGWIHSLETNSKSTCKYTIYHLKRKGSSSNHHFSGAMLNFGSVNICFTSFFSEKRGDLLKTHCPKPLGNPVVLAARVTPAGNSNDSSCQDRVNLCWYIYIYM